MSDLIDTTEMYLRTILELEEDGVVPMRARIVELLGQAGPTVSQTIARMQRDGLVELAADRSLRLTDEGRARATAVLRRHRLAERLLVDVIGLDLHLVHAEACRWEHVMSEEVEKRVLALVSDPTVSPFGNPVPGLSVLALNPPVPTDTPGAVAVRDLAIDGEATVVRFGEPLQSDHALLTQVLGAGIGIGGTCHVSASPDGSRTVRGATGSVVLREPLSRHLMVVPVAVTAA
ncbi:MAG: metal-dependent transcriptional regulator [Kineosporiaceae bacterium]